MPVTQAKLHAPGAVRYDGWKVVAFPAVSPGANVAGTTIQAYLPLVTGGKILYATALFSAIGTAQSAHLFNIVVGTLGAYETGASVGATQTATFGGTIAQGDTFTYTLAGVPILVTAPATPTATKLAAALVAAICDNTTPIPANSVNNLVTLGGLGSGIVGIPLNRVFGANNAAGVVTVGALCGGGGSGTGFNSITTVCTVTSSASGTFVAGGSTLAGGTAATGITTPTTDTVNYNGVYNVPAAGNAVFGNDQVLIGAPVGSTALRYNYLYHPDTWDALYPPGTVLTLRVQTPASTGTITNLIVALAMKTYEGAATKPARLAIPNAAFLPIRDCG